MPDPQTQQATQTAPSIPTPQSLDLSEFGGKTVASPASSASNGGNAPLDLSEFGGTNVSAGSTNTKPTSLPPSGYGILADAALGALSGAGGAVFETAQGGINLANKLIKAGSLHPDTDVQIPSIPAEYRTERNTAEKVGGYAENVGEFILGDEALKGLSLADKFGIAQKVVKVADEHPLVAKILDAGMNALRSSTVGATQGGVKGAAEGDAAGGAKAGAIGGALGSVAADLTTSGVQKLASLFGVGRDAAGEMMRVAKPGKWDTSFTPNFLIAAPRMAEELNVAPWKSLEDVADAALEAKDKLWNGEIKDAISRHEDNFLNVTSIADDLRQKATNPTLRAFSPEGAQEIEKMAQTFDKMGGMKVGDVEQTLEHLNAKLTNEGWWKKSGAERAAAGKVGDPLAVVDDAARGIREKLYDHLENAGEPEIRNLKQEYGALAQIEHNLRGQVNVQGRQVPLSLKNMVALTGAAVAGPKGWAAAAIPVIDQYVNNPTRMAARAVRAAAGEEPTLMKAGRTVAPVVKSLSPATGATVGERNEIPNPEANEGLQLIDSATQPNGGTQ